MKQEQQKMAKSSVEYTIGGVKIDFPCKAYPSQLAMMNSVSAIPITSLTSQFSGLAQHYGPL